MLTILPTIDTEGTHGSKPFDQMILGKLNNVDEEWGVFKLAKLFYKHDVKATFFVDVYEHSLWGQQIMRDLCLKLIDFGADVQLHTHPAWRDDPRDFKWLRKYKKKYSYMKQEKDFMTKLNLNEQIQILYEGIDLLDKWTNVIPIAHRGGGYSINDNTIKALQEVKIPIDSSMHWGHDNSHLTWTKNAIIKRDNIIELPVTILNYVFSLPFIGNIYSKGMKTDIDTCSLHELIEYTNIAKSKNIKLMNLFMHSYSLLDFNQDYTKFLPDHNTYKRLDNFLSMCKDIDDIQIISCTEFYRQYQEKPESFEGSDFVPDVKTNLKIINLAKEKFINHLGNNYRKAFPIYN